jgi:hypothetical protein
VRDGLRVWEFSARGFRLGACVKPYLGSANQQRIQLKLMCPKIHRSTKNFKQGNKNASSQVCQLKPEGCLLVPS